jgi:IS30 family transposase
MHTHLKRDQRIALGALRRAGFNQSDIAKQLSVHRSTISRELKRNRMKSGKYHAWNADTQAKERRKQSKVQYRKIDVVLSNRIAQRLNPLISPETVARELGIHHQTIYTWIQRDRPALLPQLPQRGRKRRRYGSKRAKKQGWTRHVRSIHERPASALAWEGDTIKGKTRSRILTHVERTSLYTRADLIPDGTGDSVHAVLKAAPLSGTITYDRGSEFSLWQMIERDTQTTVFFADAHHPWQRGKNENTNGRLRRIFPKRMDFATITQSQLDEVVHLMNHTPRKTLHWKTPAQVFREICCSSD